MQTSFLAEENPYTTQDAINSGTLLLLLLVFLLPFAAWAMKEIAYNDRGEMKPIVVLIGNIVSCVFLAVVYMVNANTTFN